MKKTRKQKVEMGIVAALLILLSGCAVSNHGVFPKLVWYWSTDAQLQREYDKERKAHEKAFREVGEELSKEAPR